MKRWLWTGLVIAGAAGVTGACTDQNTTAQTAELTGTNDLIQASVNGGNLLFIIASDRDELKVLDLNVAPTKDFVRAPNPLEPLTIPVLPRPIELARDIRYENDAEVSGPYVYVRGEGSADVSIIGADPSLLTVVRQIRADAAVTTLAARGAANGDSRLFVATAAGKLWQFDLPGPDVLRGDASVTSTDLALPLAVGESVVSLLVLPDSTQIAVATRSNSGTSGRAFVYNTQAKAIVNELNFPKPVRKLIIPPAYASDLTSAAPGARIFGILDEGTCGPVPSANLACRGIVSVDASNASAPPSATVRFLDALITDLTFIPNGSLTMTDGTERAIPLIGVATTSSSYTSASSLVVGPLHFFNADAMTLIDTVPGGPAVGVRYRVSSSDVPSEIPDAGFGPTNVALAEGAVSEEIVFVTFEDAIPGLTEVLMTADGKLPVAPDDVAKVQTNDTLLINDAQGQPLCTFVVQGVTNGEVTATGAASCPGGKSFTVIAGDAAPYVVRGTRTGYRGRIQLGDSFSEGGLTFTLAPTVPPGQVRGSQFTLTLSDNFVPYSVTLAPNQATGLAVPTTVVYGTGLGTPTVFVAYPAAAAVVEVIVGRLLPNTTVTDTRNIPTFR